MWVHHSYTIFRRIIIIEMNSHWTALILLHGRIALNEMTRNPFYNSVSIDNLKVQKNKKQKSYSNVSYLIIFIIRTEKSQCSN